MIRTKLTDMFRFFEINKYTRVVSKATKCFALALALLLPFGNALAEGNASVTYCVNGDRKVNVYADSGYSSYYFSLNGGPKIYAGTSATFAFEMPAGFAMPTNSSVKVYGGETELSVTVKPYTISASITSTDKTDGSVKLTAGSSMSISGDAVVTYSWYLFDSSNNDAIKTAVDAHNKATAFGYTKSNIGTDAEIASQTIEPCGQWVALVLENKGCCYDTTFAFVVPQPICPSDFKTTEELTTAPTATDCKASGLTIPSFNACGYSWSKGSESGTGSTGVSNLMFSNGESITWTLTNGTSSNTKTQTCTTTISIKDATVPLCPINTTRTHTDVCTLSKNDITTEIKGIVSGYATALDNCTSNDALSVSVTDALELKANGEKTYSYTIADAAGNTATCSQTIKIEIADFTIPTVTSAKTVACLSEVKAPHETGSGITMPEVVDVLGNELSYTGPVEGGTYDGCEGTKTYTYTYVDCTGLESHSHDWVYTYTITKATPVISSTGYETSKNITCIAEATEPTAAMVPKATNSCGEAVTPSMVRTIDWTDGKENCTGKIIYTYTYTDCGKSSEWVFTYNLKNEVVPTISTSLTNSSKECNWDGKDAPVVADFTVTDNCKSDAKVTLVAGEIITNDCSRSQTWTATYTNACGVNAESKTITYTWIEDHENPTITSSVSTTNAVNAGECKYQVPNVIALATIHDNCTTDEKLNISQNPVAGTYITENTDVTITVVDGCNNTSTKTITVNLPAVLDATITSSESFCYGTDDGIIEGTISNGVAPYVVEWSGAASGSLSNQNSIHIDNLPDGNYTVKVTDANGCSIEKTATIAQLTQTITVTAKSAEQIYNGESLSKNEYEVSGTLEPGDVIADVVISGSRTDVGISANVVESFKIMRGAQDVTCYYDTAMRNSTLEVKCRPITITAATKEFKYDGTVHSDAGYKVVGLVRPDTLSAVVEGSIQYVSESPVINVLKSYTFTTGKESNYCVTKENGTLTMKYECQNITIAANSNSWTYDGQSHSEDGYTLTIGTGEGAPTYTVGADGVYTFANGDVLTVDVTGSITNVSQTPVENVASVVSILNGREDVRDAYCITNNKGTLSVTKASLNITINDTKIYDGMPLVTPITKATATGLVEGDALQAGEVKTDGKDVKTYQYSESSMISTAYTTTKGIENYDVTYNLTQNITKRPITFTSATAEKVYDGTELTKHEVYVSGDGLVQNETVSFDVTGTITNIGSVANTFTYSWGDGVKADNYEVEKIEGTLKITENTSKIVITSLDYSWTYNCGNHTYERYEVTYAGNPVTEVSADGKTFTLPTGDKLTITSTAAGVTYYDATYSENNTFTYVLENDAQYQGDRDTTYGTLSIDKRPIVITAKDSTIIYNGKVLSRNEFVTDGNEASCDKVVSATIVGSQLEVGESDNIVSNALIKSEDVDVTDNYDISYNKGTLKVSPLDVVVTITGNTKTTIYNGAKQDTMGYVWSANTDLYTVDDFAFTGDSTVSGTNIGTYPMGLADSQFENVNENFGNVTFKVTDGELKITPLDVVVTIVGNKKETIYNGAKQDTMGYVWSANTDLYKVTDFEFSGDSTVSGTNIGTYPMNLSADQFTNKNSNFGDVKFNVTDGELKIEPLDVVVTIVGNKKETIYNGAKQDTMGYVWSANTDLYKVTDFEFSGDSTVSDTNIGTYPMNLSADQFTNKNSNFGDVKFNVTDGWLQIDPRENVIVTITKHSETVTYDGEEHTVSGYDFDSSDPLYIEDYIDFLGEESDSIAKGTTIGSYGMNFDDTSFVNTNKNFKDVKFVVNSADSLVIEALGGVTVTITEHADTFIYDGNDHTVTGYEVSISDPLYTESDFIFKGDSSITGNEEGEYSMPVVADSFVNINNNFADVQFVIVPDTMLITPRENVIVTITKHSETVTYDGEEHTVSGYDFDSSDPLYIEDYIEFLGTPADSTAKGTTIGSYGMNFDDTSFVNTNHNFKDVKFVVNSADSLRIEALGGVIVTITEHADTFIYDGNDHKVTGYDVVISNPLYKETDFIFNGDSSITGNEEGEYSMPVVADSFVNINDNFADVQFVIIPDTMLITPRENVIVTITKHSETVTYDGEEHTVSGYDFDSSDPLYIENYIDFLGEPSDSIARGTTIGSYGMNFDDTSFVNTNKNFKDVKFVVNSADSLVIEALGGVEVTITKHSDAVTFDGEEHMVSGYDFVSSDPLYIEDYISFLGNPSDSIASGTTAGSYGMNFDDTSFVNTNPNFKDVKFIVKDADSLVIEPRGGVEVTITKHSDAVTFDGKEHIVSGYDFSSNDTLYVEEFIQFLGTAEDSIARGTEVGSYGMNFDDTSFVNTNPNFKDVTFIVNDADSLIITPRKDVIVTIIPHSGIEKYTNATYTVEGYEVEISDSLYTEDDFLFSGTAKVSNKEVGEYPMQLANEEFTNLNKNFNVIFDIKEGGLTITKNDTVIVYVYEGGRVDTYDGKRHEVTEFRYKTNNNFYSYSDVKRQTGVSYVASGTEVGSYRMNLQPEYFENKNANYENVQFVIIPDSLVILPRTDVHVTIIPSSDTILYDGEEHIVRGYEFIATDSLFSETDFIFSGVDSMSVVDAGEYELILSESDFQQSNNNFGIVSFEVEKGHKTIINPIDLVNVYISENIDTFVYDGIEKSVTGYHVDSIDNVLYKESDFVFNGVAEISASDAGRYSMNLNSSDFENKNTNFKEIQFIIQHDSMVIEPMRGVEVTIVAHGDTFEFDGRAHSVSGYEVIANSELYQRDFINFRGDSIVTATEVGEYSMELTADDFQNTNPNFEDVIFKVDNDNQLIIESLGGVQVVLKKHGDVLSYNGTEQRVTGYDLVSISDTLYTADDFNFIGTESDTVAARTTIGTAVMSLSADDFQNNNATFEDVRFIVLEDTLTIVPNDHEIVTIHEGAQLVPFDGEEHMVTGFSFTSTDGAYTENSFIFNGKDTVYGKEVGAYSMNLQPENFTNIDSNYVDVTFVIEHDSLAIVPLQAIVVTIYEHADTLVFNGKEQIVSGYDIESSISYYDAKDFDFVGDSVVSMINTGDYKMNLKVSDFHNTNENFTDVTFKVVPAVSRIEPKDTLHVTIYGSIDSVYYNGKYQEVTGYTVKPEEGFEFYKEFKFTGNETATGIRVGTYTMGMKASDFTNTSKNYKKVIFDVIDGYIFIDKVAVPIIITANSNSKVYDGTPLIAQGYSYTKNALQKGDDIRATIEGTITNVGTVENRVVSYKIVRGSEDVTSNYNFGHTENGTLTILPRKVSLTSASDSKEYDGTPLTNDNVTVGEKGWAKGEGATYHVTGSQTQLGSSANTFDYELFENTLASNYEIVKEEGRLTVGTNLDEVIITAVTDTFLYDGKEHTGRFSVSGLIGKGDSLVVELSGALTDAGTVENKVVSYQVIRGAEDVTDNYTFGPSVDGEIVVTPRKVTLISASAEQEYNGQELTNDTVVAGGDGWAAGEGATYTVTGSRLYVGDTINTFTYELNDNTKADNYIITKEEGVLSVFVNTQLIEITAASNKKEYDGTPLEDSTYTFTEGVLAEGDELIVIVKGSITEVGRTTNEVDSFRIMRGDVDVTNCYNVETYKGELVVTESSHHPFVIVGNDHAIEMYNVNNVVRVYDMLGRMIKINGAFEAHVGEYYKLEVMNPGVYVVYVNDDENGYKVIVR